MMRPVSQWAQMLFVLIISNLNSYSEADINSGCPSWGCLPWGSFALSAGIPSSNCTIPWRVELETVSSAADDNRVPRGCVSGQQTVVCTTQSGYVSIDPTNGKMLWNYTTRSPPYLPVMDIYGDVIGMDSQALYYVGADGTPQHPIGVAILKSLYSPMIGNDSILFLTGSTNKTAQIVTYLTDGIVDASFSLKGTIDRMNGTFIPCSQPIIAGFRAYIMTYFSPDEPGSEEADRLTGMLRLYAIDILHQLAPRLVMAWYFNFGKWNSIYKYPISFKERNLHNNKNILDPIVTYFNGNVYVNVPGSLNGVREAHSDGQQQPYPGSLWAIRDDGNGGSLLFRTSCIYGPMAVYDTYDKPLSESKGSRRGGKGGDEGHLVWVMNRSPAMIQGYDAHNGTFKEISGFDSIFEKLTGWITSSLSITRSKTSPDNDQLVFGMSDSKGRASISIVEVSGSQATLVLSRIVSTGSKTNNMALVEGQIVNFAFYPPMDDSNRVKDKEDTWKLGLAVMVKEFNSTSISRTVVGLF